MASRRDFIRISGLGLGAMAISASGYGVIKGIAGGPLDSEGLKLDTSRTPTYCEICFWKCAGWVYKNDEGKIWKVIGNDDDQHSNGRFCPRGTGGPGMYYDSDRLRTPLIRTEERGKQTFREASWDEALDYIADKMKAIAEEHGPECIALLTHGSGGKYFGNLLKAMDLPASQHLPMHSVAVRVRWPFRLPTGKESGVLNESIYVTRIAWY